MHRKRSRGARSAHSPQGPRRNFRERYDEIERARTALIERLALLGARARTHPSFKRALTLLNTTFRKSSVAQRLAILQAAQWLIDFIEMSSGMI